MSETVIQWREVPTVVHRIASATETIAITELFPAPQPLELEIGCGDGSFLTKYATEHPEINFIGVERLLGRLKKLDRFARRNRMTNLSLMRIEAAYLLRYLLPAGLFDAIHVYFPDPWPKKKHERNRLVVDEFTLRCRELLTPKGLVHLRTDDVDYFTQMEEVFGRSDSFTKVDTPDELKGFTTDFEREFNAEGIPTNYSSWQRT